MLLPGLLWDCWCAGVALSTGAVWRVSCWNQAGRAPPATNPSDLQEATHLVVEHIPSYLPAGAGASCVTGRQTLLFWFDGTRR